jgi:hypothetical protein
MVRELGLERRETVRFLSFIYKKTKEGPLIREDRGPYPTGKQVVIIIFKHCLLATDKSSSVENIKTRK